MRNLRLHVPSLDEIADYAETVYDPDSEAFETSYVDNGETGRYDCRLCGMAVYTDANGFVEYDGIHGSHGQCDASYYARG